MRRACLNCLSFAAAAARAGIWAISLIAVLAFVAVSLSRPAPKSGQQVPPASTQDEAGDLAALEQNSAPQTESLPPPSALSALVWDKSNAAWSTPGSRLAAAYRPGDTVPLLLTIDSLTVGRYYTVTLEYSACPTDSAAAIDSLAGFPEADAKPLLAPPTAGRIRPDSAMAVPGTATEPSSELRLWGGVFSDAARVLPGENPCRGALALKLLVQQEELVLAFGGRLANAPGNEGTGTLAPVQAVVQD